jgi:hypothetical protein
MESLSKSSATHTPILGPRGLGRVGPLEEQDAVPAPVALPPLPDVTPRGDDSLFGFC